MHPEGERDLYTSIIYLEPFEGRNLRALGFDMYSESVRRQAMEQARDEDKATLSGKVLLLQESAKDMQAGVLMYVPVYRNGKPHETLAERRANILGWTYSPFRMNDLMLGILGDQSNRMDIEIYDGNSMTPQTLLYDSQLDLAPDQVSPYQFTKNIEFSGRHWMMKMHALPNFEAQMNTEQVTAIRLIGIAVSIVLSMLIWQLTSGRARALKLAKVMTQELSRAQSLAKLGNWQVIFGKDESQDKWTVSDELRKIWGLSDTQGINTQGGFATILPEDHDLTRNYWAEAKQGKGPTEWEHRILVSGKIKWVNVLVDFTFDAEGKPLKARGTIQDITERKQMEEQVRQLAFYDTLTKLPNRRLLSDRLDQAMSASQRNGLYSALMFLDLDNFKPLNDTHGHVVGDLLLIEAANRLKDSVRGMDTVARFGGDEFVVILSELDAEKSKSTAQAKLVAEKILASLSDPYLLTLMHDGQADTVVEHRCTASIGVALFVNHEGSQDDIMGWADAAMYLAKKGGRNQIQFYDAKD